MVILHTVFEAPVVLFSFDAHKALRLLMTLSNTTTMAITGRT